MLSFIFTACKKEEGCTDLVAVNYNVDAEEDDGSCLFAYGDCQECVNGVVINNDSDNDGICDIDDLCPNDP